MVFGKTSVLLGNMKVLAIVFNFILIPYVQEIAFYI